MSCNQSLTGISKDCAPNMGGIRKLLLNLASAIASVTVDGTSKKISAITLVEDNGDPVSKFKAFAIPKGACSLAHSLTADPANGTNFVTNTLAILVNRMDTEKRVAISAAAVSECVAIVVDNNGKAWYLGKDEPLTANGGDSGTGAAKTDRNGYGLNLTNEEESYPYEIDLAQVDIDDDDFVD